MGLRGRSSAGSLRDIIKRKAGPAAAQGPNYRKIMYPEISRLLQQLQTSSDFKSKGLEVKYGILNCGKKAA